MSDEFEATPTGIDRRTFMKSSAVVGGLVWAAPAMSTLGARAFAGSPLDLCPPIGTQTEQPSNLQWLYTGLGCEATDSPQFDNVVDNFPYCTDYLDYPDQVSGRTLKLLIVGIPGGQVEQTVFNLVPGQTTFFSPTQGGRAGANTYFEIRDAVTDDLYHKVGFHTSCSESLRIGDNFGSFKLIAGEEGQGLAPA